jgi:hypothetical protein
MADHYCKDCGAPEYDCRCDEGKCISCGTYLVRATAADGPMPLPELGARRAFKGKSRQFVRMFLARIEVLSAWFDHTADS